MGNEEYVPEPPLLEEKSRIYAFQVPIPLIISGETHVFVGHVPNLNSDASLISILFHVYHRTRPLANKKKLDDKGKLLTVAQPKPQQYQVKSSTDASIVYDSISLDYMNNTLKVFSSTPLAKDHEPYYA